MPEKIKEITKLEKVVEERLQKGKNRREIWEEFRSDKNEHKLLFLLNNMSYPNLRKIYQIPNLILATVLIFLTTKKLIAMFSFGRFDIFLLLQLVVPIINIYILKEILRFHRIGYQFLFVLSCLSLLQPENHQPQEAILIVIMIGISGFLYLKMFPKNSLLQIELNT